jgi:RNA polymerase sigma factor (sigma-70 family)
MPTSREMTGRAAPAAEEFIDSLYRAHAVTLVRVALLLVGDQPTAEDVVQDAFLQLYRGLPRLRDRDKALPYLRASVVNGARSMLRARRRALLRKTQHQPAVWSAESAALEGEERRAVLGAVARLPRRSREVLALRYYLDLPRPGDRRDARHQPGHRVIDRVPGDGRARPRPEGGAVNTLEDRLRDAYQAAAHTVQPESVLAGGARHPRDRDQGTRRDRHGRRLLIPFAAAAAVTAVVAGSTMLAQHTVAGPGRHRGQVTPATAATGTPRFFVAMNWTLHPSMFVVNAATGARGAAITPPFPATELRGVATGDGRTFVVAAARPGVCRTALYRFVLSPAGRPAAMTEFATVPGAIGLPWSMAVAGNGRTIAYSAQPGCPAGPPSGRPAQHQDMAYLAVVNTTTGHTKRWPFVNRPGPGEVSLSADGREVSLGDRVLPTDAAEGSLASRGRLVARKGEFGHNTAIGSALLAPDGRSAYFSTFRVRSHKPAGGWQLRVFDLATGHTWLVHSFPGTQSTMAAAYAGPSGRYLLIEYDTRRGMGVTRLARLDVGSGQVTQLHASWAAEAAIAW